MTTDAQITLLHAAELLEADAESLNEYWNGGQQHPEWRGASEAHAEHDDALCTALELRLLARSIQTGSIQVKEKTT